MILQHRYALLKKQNLKLFYIYNEKNLKGFTTTEKDKQSGMNRFPLNNFRYTDSDLLKEDYNTGQVIENFDYDQGKALRDKQYAANQDFISHNAEEEEQTDEEEEEVKKSIADLPA